MQQHQNTKLDVSNEKEVMHKLLSIKPTKEYPSAIHLAVTHPIEFGHKQSSRLGQIKKELSSESCKLLLAKYKAKPILVNGHPVEDCGVLGDYRIWFSSQPLPIGNVIKIIHLQSFKNECAIQTVTPKKGGILNNIPEKYFIKLKDNKTLEDYLSIISKMSEGNGELHVEKEEMTETEKNELHTIIQSENVKLITESLGFMTKNDEVYKKFLKQFEKV